MLTLSGKINIIKKNIQFEKLKDVSLQILGCKHIFDVELGVYDEEWAIKPKKKYTKLEFEELFGFDYKCEDFTTDRIVSLSEAKVTLNGKELGVPLHL